MVQSTICWVKILRINRTIINQDHSNKVEVQGAEDRTNVVERSARIGSKRSSHEICYSTDPAFGRRYEDVRLASRRDGDGVALEDAQEVDIERSRATENKAKVDRLDSGSCTSPSCSVEYSRRDRWNYSAATDGSIRCGIIRCENLLECEHSQ